MSSESSHPQAKTLIAESVGLKRVLRDFVLNRFTALRQIKIWDASNIGHGLLAICAITSGLSVTNSSVLAPSQQLERQMQSQFLTFGVRFPRLLKSSSLPWMKLLIRQKLLYTQPKKYAYLEPLATSPWKRSAYAQVIDRVMSAGGKSVAVDVIFDAPSSYPQEDLRLQKPCSDMPDALL